jgi:hypothetical protein
VAALKGHIERLQRGAAAADEYRDGLCHRAVKACLIANPELSADVVKSATEQMDTEQLKSFTAAFERAAAKVMPPQPQLFSPEKGKPERDNNYII